MTDQATGFVAACRRLRYAGCGGQELYVDRVLYDELYGELLRNDEHPDATTDLYHGAPIRVAGVVVLPHVELVPAWDAERELAAWGD